MWYGARGFKDGYLSRSEKEAFYIRKGNELQTRWGNPYTTAGEWGVTEMTDVELQGAIDSTVGQLRFEKCLGALVTVIGLAISSVVGLGILGLLVFGIRQLF